MAGQDRDTQWTTLDRDLGRVSTLEAASIYAVRPFVGAGLAMLFVTAAAIVAALLAGISSAGSLAVVAGAVFAAYMAINIGANDVANNMGPAVGARALTMGGAIAIAAVCESAGALIGGREVITTISSGVIDQPGFGDLRSYTLAMLSAMLGAALWLNIATWIGAPISTTHAVLGAMIGAGLAAAGVAAIHWSSLAAIAATWVVSPLAGGLLSAGLLALLTRAVVEREDKIAAARIWVPVMIAAMAATFTIYLGIKGLAYPAALSPAVVIGGGALAGAAAWAGSRAAVHRASEGLENRKRSLKTLFRLPLIFSAAILSFAHGANDVANAIGPLAAIVHAVEVGHADEIVAFPFWVTMIGALGISAGLLLFGPKLVQLVGDEITRLNPLRASCIALSAGIIVILASWAGMPVSSTHITIGGVFGVGFYREWEHEQRLSRARDPQKRLPVEERTRRRLVRRSHFLTIIAAWIVTVPAAALLSAAGYLALSLVAG